MDHLLGVAPDVKRLRQIIDHDSTLGTTLHAICLKRFGVDFYEWEPEALAMEIRDEFGVECSEAGMTRLNALISSLVSDSFYNDWMAFGAVCSGLCTEDGSVDLHGFVPAAVLSWGVTEVLLNDSTPGKWSPDVRRYAGTVLTEEGIIVPPSILGWADMPQIYRGSMSGADLGQGQALDSEHKKVIEEFMEEQSLLLFKQLSFLPWVTKEDLERLSNEIQL